MRATPGLADGLPGEEWDGYGAVGNDRRAGGQMGMQISPGVRDVLCPSAEKRRYQ